MYLFLNVGGPLRTGAGDNEHQDRAIPMNEAWGRHENRKKSQLILRKEVSVVLSDLEKKKSSHFPTWKWVVFNLIWSPLWTPIPCAAVECLGRPPGRKPVGSGCLMWEYPQWTGGIGSVYTHICIPCPSHTSTSVGISWGRWHMKYELCVIVTCVSLSVSFAFSWPWLLHFKRKWIITSH